MDIGQKIKFARLKQNPPLRQWRLALLLKVSQQLLSLIETGRRKPNTKLLKACEKHLNLKIPKRRINEKNQ